jgi:hypothetical protein
MYSYAVMDEPVSGSNRNCQSVADGVEIESLNRDTTNR